MFQIGKMLEYIGIVIFILTILAGLPGFLTHGSALEIDDFVYYIVGIGIVSYGLGMIMQKAAVTTPPDKK
ncbi:MAG: hypothetical protein EON58_02785 [Alphaproteobacteria bacterium]|nr:MAG: hypothetical protein EON58_02785 [Alphaproteobacteria bacterium]